MINVEGKDYTRLIFLVILGVIMFFVYSFLSFSVWLPNYYEWGTVIFSWPDAMANFSFVNEFIDSGKFFISFPDNGLISDIVHPRSVNVFDTNLVPVSFLGLILIFGVFGKIISIYGVMFLTPLMAVTAVFFYYSLIKRVWGEYVAFLSSILLFFLGAYWYYSSMVMLHTILFIGFTLIGFWFLSHPRFTYWRLSLGSLFIGIALTVRTVEAVWILPICLLLLIIFGGKKWYWKLLVFVIFFSLVFVPVLIQNNVLYGSYFSTGYLNMDNDKVSLIERLPAEFELNSSNKVVNFVKSVFVPFGLHGKQLLKSVYKFFGQYFGPYLLLSFLGLFFFVKNKDFDKKKLFYIGTTAFVSLWLVFYYGNWVFEDMDVLKYNFISSSYARYWLPVFILLLPGVGYLLSLLRKTKINSAVKNALIFIIMISLIGHSVYFVVFSRNDGLLALKSNIEQYYFRYTQTSSLMENNAILITDKTDKIFFPKYQVVVFLLDYSIFPELYKIEDKYPIYYLTRMPDKDIEFINEKKILEYDLVFERAVIIDDEYRLFQLNKQESKN